MADIADNVPFTDPATAISQGRRHLLVRDYTMAVTALAQACELLAKKHGDTADELGEPYLLYGRALLGLAREEAGVLGGGIPGSEEAQGEEDAEDDDEDDEEDEAEEEKLSKVDEKEEEEEEEDEEEEEEEEEEGEDEDKKNNKNETTKTTTDEDSSKKNVKDEQDEEIKEEDVKKKEHDEKEMKTSSEPESENIPKNNETTDALATSSKQQNGKIQENGQHDNTEDITKDEEEDEVNNLQVAWEVLELAKLVLLKRGPPGWKLLADSYRLLGEVAMEGGNHKGALNDLQGCLNLLEKIDPREPRAIAEIHYQLGLAHSLGNDFDSSIEEFNKATMLLESRIKELEAITEPPKTDDPFYTVEGEIQELKDLLPEIREKITDMQDFKQEACKLVIESLKSEVSRGSSNGAGPSSDTSSSSASSSTNQKMLKPASDISHLVRKKRKNDEPETEVSLPPCKKPTPEKTV
ncbi:histone-binding protein N1/N2 [Vespa crabro]|uniref:histone-binding protein N1/N2 n=1 Tax=Vespa crabro TaxID=7445 RepID=UPI001F016553|nr:histone-binding protein N1/N2 [Vespa crabro]XP_046824601.1 histone-binding protein N1/N2 [Vespa crabro]